MAGVGQHAMVVDTFEARSEGSYPRDRCSSDRLQANCSSHHACHGTRSLYLKRVEILHNGDSSEGDIQKLGPYRIESLVPPDQEGQFTAYRVRIEPRQVTSESFHKVAEEIYFVVSGSGVAVLDDKEFELMAGDFLRLPPGTRHRFETHDQELILLDVHSPGSRPDRDVFFTGETPDGFSASQ